MIQERSHSNEPVLARSGVLILRSQGVRKLTGVLACNLINGDIRPHHLLE